MDFTKTSTEQLKRSLKSHENDTSTMTMEQECRRMYLVQEIGAELQRRGIDAWSPIQETPSQHEYVDAIRATSIRVGGRLVGDLVETENFGNGHQVVLTVACRPYSNATFATREGALNYMQLVAGAIQ